MHIILHIFQIVNRKRNFFIELGNPTTCDKPVQGYNSPDDKNKSDAAQRLCGIAFDAGKKLPAINMILEGNTPSRSARQLACSWCTYPLQKGRSDDLSVHRRPFILRMRVPQKDLAV